MKYENCTCRKKKKVDKLVEECIENIQETKLVEKSSTENELEHSSCTVYKVLFWIFSIFFVINIGTGIYFTYSKYISHNKENFKNDGTHQTTIW